MSKLPHSIVINIKDITFHPTIDDLDEVLSDYLCKTYNSSHFGFNYYTDIIDGVVHITDILWAAEEE